MYAGIGGCLHSVEWNGGMEYWNRIATCAEIFFSCVDVCQFSSCLGGLINGERRSTRQH